MTGSSGSPLPPLGLLGLGAMGAAMARSLLRAGYRLVAYDINAERLAACAAAGAAPAENEADVVRRAEYVLTSLRSSAVFVEVAQAHLIPNARAGQVFIDLGTTAPPEARRLAAEFAAREATLIEAPVSGGPQGAETGMLRIFVGGDEVVATRCRPILEVLGDPARIVYCGPSGAGQVVKGVNQLAMGLGDAAYLEAIAFGVRAGVDPSAILTAVGGDEGWRGHFGSIARRVADGEGMGVTVKFPELEYFLHEAREGRFALPLSEALHAFCDAGERITEDNMGRPEPSFWRELTTRPHRDP